MRALSGSLSTGAAVASGQEIGALHVKKAKKQKPARRKRTRAEAKAIRQTAGTSMSSFEAGLTPSLREFRRYLLAADAVHWKGESSDIRWVYEAALDKAFNEDTLTLSPVSIQQLEDEAQGFVSDYDPDDPDAIEPLQEPVEILVKQLVERGLITFDSGSGMISVVPLPAPVGP